MLLYPASAAGNTPRIVKCLANETPALRGRVASTSTGAVGALGTLNLSSGTPPVLAATTVPTGFASKAGRSGGVTLSSSPW
jgi:hypothetical protein